MTRDMSPLNSDAQGPNQLTDDESGRAVGATASIDSFSQRGGARAALDGVTGVARSLARNLTI